jgi:hypothetical protein
VVIVRQVRSASLYGIGTNVTQEGSEISMDWPVRARRPVVGSMRKTTMVSESWLAARRRFPEPNRANSP